MHAEHEIRFRALQLAIDKNDGDVIETAKSYLQFLSEDVDARGPSAEQAQSSAARADVAPHAPTAVMPEAPAQGSQPANVGSAGPNGETAPAPAPQPVQPEQAQSSAPAPGQAPSQADLIHAFTELGKAKGRDVIGSICAEYGVQQVIAIPQDKWGEAIGKAQAALNG